MGCRGHEWIAFGGETMLTVGACAHVHVVDQPTLVATPFGFHYQEAVAVLPVPQHQRRLPAKLRPWLPGTIKTPPKIAPLMRHRSFKCGEIPAPTAYASALVRHGPEAAMRSNCRARQTCRPSFCKRVWRHVSRLPDIVWGGQSVWSACRSLTPGSYALCNGPYAPGMYALQNPVTRAA